MAGHVFAAVDVGASSGRVTAGIVDSGRITLDVLHRFPNGARDDGGHLRWNLTEILREIQIGLRLLPAATSIGIDTWGVDYGLLDDDGRLLAEPVSYRDDRTAKYIDEVHALVPPETLFNTTGLQFLPFTTIYQLAAERREQLWSRTRHVVLLPDLLTYWLTGDLATEVTNASTTGLLDVRLRHWARGLLTGLDLSTELFPHLVPPGTPRGRTPDGIDVVTVASHDTASAVAGVPATTPKFAYIVCGTWALVGLELERPVLTAQARDANFTNELGVGGRTRFLRNFGGLWLVQECMRHWGRSDLPDLLRAAAQIEQARPRIDVDDPAFIAPGDMPNRIITASGISSMSEPQVLRCILDSLAEGFARTVHQAAVLSGATVDVIHVVGGGAHNELLCQLTANAAQIPVIAGPVEATALGSVAVQARAAGVMPDSIDAARAQIAASTPLRRYEPK